MKPSSHFPAMVRPARCPYCGRVSDFSLRGLMGVNTARSATILADTACCGQPVTIRYWRSIVVLKRYKTLESINEGTAAPARHPDAVVRERQPDGSTKLREARIRTRVFP